MPLGIRMSSTSSTFLTLAAASLLPFSVSTAAHAGEMPDDIWSGKHGGFPSITANAESGVSLALPAQAVEEAGGGALSQIAKSFLDRWAPSMCSAAFDFQSPHKDLKIEVALMKPAGSGTGSGSRVDYYVTSGYRIVTIDYEPDEKITCVKPADRIS